MRYAWAPLFLLKSSDMINFPLMLLSCCNGKDDGYKPGKKNTCFSIIMPLSIKNISDEKRGKKKSQETGPTGIKFLAT